MSIIQFQELFNILVHLLTAINTTSTSTDGIITAINDLATDIEPLTTKVSNYSFLELSNDIWQNIPNRSIEFTYYTGIEAGNPSGTTTNVKTAILKDGVTTVITKTYTYDVADSVLTIVSA